MSEFDTIRLDLPASYKFLHVLGLCLQGMLERIEGLTELDITVYNMQLAAQEICTNIVDHAYAGRADGRIDITITSAAEPVRLVVELRDTGRQFDPSAVQAPNLDEAQIHGYGLFLVHSLMDDVSYEPLPDGNRWRLTKYL
jgi:serine/threonine-protein kinase RsbW